ncbi:MAG: diguanylate cyclase [Thermoanaerobaculia bacterium]
MTGPIPEVPTLKLLLVEDSPSMSETLTDVLGEDPRQHYAITHVTRLSDAMTAIEQGVYEICLLDLGLPDAQGFKAPRTIHLAAPELPIVVITGTDDEQVAEESAAAGIQDFLLKQELTPSVLRRTIRYARERNRLLCELKSQAFKDDLTGLYNRRGFFTIAEQQVKMAGRVMKLAQLFYVDVDGMKVCNDTLGHAAGDRLLVHVAGVLEDTFRDSDVIGRLGGDEFAILAIDAGDENMDSPLARLESAMNARNLLRPECFGIALSVGLATALPNESRSLEELVREADQMMYAQKRVKRSERRTRTASRP